MNAFAPFIIIFTAHVTSTCVTKRVFPPVIPLCHANCRHLSAKLIVSSTLFTSTEVREGKLDLVKAEEVAVQPEEGALTNGILREGPGEEDNIEVEE